MGNKTLENIIVYLNVIAVKLGHGTLAITHSSINKLSYVEMVVV